MSQKHLDLAGLTAYDRILKEWFKAGVVDIADEAIHALFVTVAEGPADNEIWYYTTDNSVAKVWGDTKLDYGNPNWCQNIYIGNVYTDKGILTFQNPLTILEGDEDGVGGQIFYYDDGSRGISYAEKVHTIILPKTLLGIHDALINIPLQNIIFMGTKEQWNNIDKSSRFFGNIPWNEGAPATYVQCTDGQVQL